MTNEFLRGYLPYLLQRADQLLSDAFHRGLADEGIAMSEWRVLAVLRDGGARGVGELAEMTMLPQPTTTHAITRLEADGLLTRQRSFDDRRRRSVALTKSGERLADRLIATARANEARVLGSIDPAIGPDVRGKVARMVAELDENL